MRTTMLIAAFVPLLYLIRLFMSLSAATARVWKGGAGEAAEFDRAGFGLRPFFVANVDRQDSGSLIPTRAGIDAQVRDGRLVIEETRAVSKDVF